MELHKRVLGLAVGVVWGLSILLGTWWLLLRGAPGEMFSKLGSFYIGYSFSWDGAIIGFIWAFAEGFLAGFLLTWLYEKFSKMLYKSKTNA